MIHTMPDNKRIVSCSDDKQIKVWDVNSPASAVTTLTSDTRIYCVHTIDNNTLFSGHYDKEIRVWDLNSGKVVRTLKGHTNSVFCLSNMDSRVLVSGGTDNSVKFWDLNNDSCTNTFTGHTKPVSCVMKYNDKQVICGSNDGYVRIWSVNGQNAQQPDSMWCNHSDGVYTLVPVLQDAAAGISLIASGSWDQTVRIWNDGCEVKTLNNTSGVLSLACV